MLANPSLKDVKAMLDGRLSVKAMLAVAQILLSDPKKRDHTTDRIAMNVLYRAYRDWVLAFAKDMTDGSIADALDLSAKFWRSFFEQEEGRILDRYTGGSVAKWFENLVISRFIGLDEALLKSA